MSEKLEQTSELTAEDNLPNEVQADSITALPLHAQQCMELLSVPQTVLPVIRCFRANDGHTFLGVLLGESKDSFLVGAPIRLIMSKSGVVLTETLSTEPVVRYMKGGLISLTTASEQSLYYYYTFLMKDGRILLPQVVNKENSTEIKEWLNDHAVEENEIFTTSKVQESKKRDIPGASEYAFESLMISEKIH